jgi:hypothetical protein
VIDRRILVNYRVEAAVLADLLPPPFRPQCLRGWGMVGICLIRLKQLRPVGWPRWLGIGSENAAHRAAVEWTSGETTRYGVYIRRRDSNSWLNTLAGGRLFPGVHHHARFHVKEGDEHFSVALTSSDGETNLSVQAKRTTKWPATSVFTSLADASEFYRAGSLGYSATSEAARFQGLHLHCDGWRTESLAVEEVQSSYFEDTARFPPGSIEFDNALLMRGIEHAWQSEEDLCCSRPATASTI